MIANWFVLTPFHATILFVIAIVAGHQYRKFWKSGGPTWKLWISGLVAAACLLIVALIPLATP